MLHAPLPLLALSLAACAKKGALSQPSAAEPAVRREKGTLTVSPERPLGRHPGADLCFPTVGIGGWTFAGTHQYDNPQGLDISWSYGHEDGTVVTIYAYPQRGPAPEGMTAAEAEAQLAAQQVSDATWSGQGQVQVDLFPTPGVVIAGVQSMELAPLIPPEQRADAARQLGLSSLDGVYRDFGALVLVLAPDPWFLKVRATWLDSERPAEEMIGSVFGWTVLPCEILRSQAPDIPIVDVPPEGLPAQEETL